MIGNVAGGGGRCMYVIYPSYILAIYPVCRQGGVGVWLVVGGEV